MFGQRQMVQAYLNAKFSTLSPCRLQLELYEGLQRFVAGGKEAFEKGDRAAGRHHCERAFAVVVEMQTSLQEKMNNPTSEGFATIQHVLGSLIATASLRGEPELLSVAYDVVHSLCDAWYDACLNAEGFDENMQKLSRCMNVLTENKTED